MYAHSLPDTPGRARTSRLWPGYGPVVLVLLLIGGTYAPTSLDGVISKDLLLYNLTALFSLLALLIFRRDGALGPWSILCAVAIPGCLLGFSLTSPFVDFAYGALAPYGIFALLVTLRLRDLSPGEWVLKPVLAASIVNLAAAGIFLFDLADVRLLLTTYYMAHYQELVPLMLDSSKPVLTFASHSIAGFFFYLFFFLNFETYRTLGRRANLVVAAGYLPLMFALNSTTGYLFGIGALIQLTVGFPWMRGVFKGVGLALIVVPGIVFAALRIDFRGYFDLLEHLVFGSEMSGLGGRYSSTGALAANIDYIANNPFQPIGLGLSNMLFYGDSGPIEHLTRGSLPLLAAIYAGFYIFLKRNLRSTAHFHIVLAAFLVFEVGYSNLNYFRSQAFLPVLIVYLNALPRSAGAPAAARHRSRPLFGGGLAVSHG